MAATCWVSAATFRWTPILTFTRRRLELLDWIDANLDTLAFLEEHDLVGIALQHHDLRLEVDRSQMILRTAAGAPPVETLSDLVDGVLSVMAPSNIRASSFSSVWSQPLGTEEYNEATAQFGQRISIGAPEPGGFRVTDGSGLVDIESLDWRGQLEFGIVSPAELVSRLHAPGVGRLGTNSGRRWDEIHTPPDEEDLPPASLFTDCFVTRRHGGRVNGVDDVMSTMSDTQATIESVVDAMMNNFPKYEGGTDELAEAE